MCVNNTQVFYGYVKNTTFYSCPPLYGPYYLVAYVFL